MSDGAVQCKMTFTGQTKNCNFTYDNTKGGRELFVKHIADSHNRGYYRSFWSSFLTERRAFAIFLATLGAYASIVFFSQDSVKDIHLTYPANLILSIVAVTVGFFFSTRRYWWRKRNLRRTVAHARTEFFKSTEDMEKGIKKLENQNQSGENSEKIKELKKKYTEAKNFEKEVFEHAWIALPTQLEG